MALAFILGIVLTILGTSFFRQLKKKNLQDDLEFLQFERDHREMIRESKIHRDRVARRSIFSALFFLGFVLLVTLGIAFYPFTATPDKGTMLSVIHYLPIVLWLLYINYVYFLWKRYKNINSYQKHLYKIDAKMVKARKKLEKKK